VAKGGVLRRMTPSRNLKARPEGQSQRGTVFGLYAEACRAEAKFWLF